MSDFQRIGGKSQETEQYLRKPWRLRSRRHENSLVYKSWCSKDKDSEEKKKVVDEWICVCVLKKREHVLCCREIVRTCTTREYCLKLNGERSLSLVYKNLRKKFFWEMSLWEISKKGFSDNNQNVGSYFVCCPLLEKVKRELVCKKIGVWFKVTGSKIKWKWEKSFFHN